jgi:hypothetical protein
MFISIFADIFDEGVFLSVCRSKNFDRIKDNWSEEKLQDSSRTIHQN